MVELIQQPSDRRGARGVRADDERGREKLDEIRGVRIRERRAAAQQGDVLSLTMSPENRSSAKATAALITGTSGPFDRLGAT